jgi:hypothetical protein
MTDETASPKFDESKKSTGRAPGPSGLPPGSREARRHPRFLVYGAVASLRRKGARSLFGLLGGSASGQVIDLSEGGARLSIPAELPVDTPIELQIDIERFKDRIASPAIVRWCHRDPAAPSRHLVGVKFDTLDASAVKKIGRMRSFFTSEHCEEFRERKSASERHLPKQPSPEEPPSDPRAPIARELEPGIWIISPRGSLAGSDLDALAKSVEDVLGHDARGLLLDLQAADVASTPDLTRFLRIVDQAAFRGARTVFVGSPPSLTTLIQGRKDSEREFAPNIFAGRTLLVPTAPPGSDPENS